MRQIISTAVVAVVVGAVAGATMGAVAQPGPEAAQQAIVPSVTSINAHKVDGRHAVSASASRKKRRGKLVATNRQGYLPSNIIKPAWKLIGGKPPAFADGQIGWGEVASKPGGFADGVDNSHRNTLVVTGLDETVFTVSASTSFSGFEVPSSNVRISVEPITLDRRLEVRDLNIKKIGDGTHIGSWTVGNLNSGLGSADFRMWITDFGTGPNGPTTSQIKAARSLESGKVRKGK